MSKHVTVGMDAFSRGVEELLGDIPNACGDALETATTQSARSTAKKLRGEYTAGIGRNPWSAEYRNGFSSHVERNGLNVTGEVGNRAKPGLVHLLEKGHATLTERRTQAYPHMAPAFEDMEDDFVKRASDALGRVLE